MKEIDTLQRFLFEHASIRGEIAHLGEVYKTIIQQHHYPPAVKTLLGEALIACVLLAGSIKFEGEISLQFHGDKRLPLILVQCDHDLHIRGFAKFQEQDEEQQPIDYVNAFIAGKMVLIINQYQQTQSYQSVVPIHSVSMADNLMHYFAQSEQLSTRVWLAVGEDGAAGMLLQLMPGQNTMQREQFWEYAVHLGQTISDQELLSLDNATILYRLYHETEIRLYHARSIEFRCRCTAEKMQQVLSVLGEQDVRQLLKEKGQIDVSCDFCNHHYAFDAIDIELLFRV